MGCFFLMLKNCNILLEKEGEREPNSPTLDFLFKKKNEFMTFKVTTRAHLATSSVTLGTPSASLSLAVFVETLRPMSASPTALGYTWRGHQVH